MKFLKKLISKYHNISGATVEVEAAVEVLPPLGPPGISMPSSLGHGGVEIPGGEVEARTTGGTAGEVTNRTGKGKLQGRKLLLDLRNKGNSSSRRSSIARSQPKRTIKS